MITTAQTRTMTAANAATEGVSSPPRRRPPSWSSSLQRRRFGIMMRLLGGLFVVVLAGGNLYATTTTTTTSTAAASTFVPPPVSSLSTLPARITLVDCIVYNGEPIVPFRIAALYHVVDWFYMVDRTADDQNATAAAATTTALAPYRDKIRWLDEWSSSQSSLPDSFSSFSSSAARVVALFHDTLARDFAPLLVQSSPSSSSQSSSLVVLHTLVEHLPHPDVLAQFQPGERYYEVVTRQPAYLETATEFVYNLHWTTTHTMTTKDQEAKALQQRQVLLAHTVPGTWLHHHNHSSSNRTHHHHENQQPRKKIAVVTIPHASHNLRHAYSLEQLLEQQQEQQSRRTTASTTTTTNTTTTTAPTLWTIRQAIVQGREMQEQLYNSNLSSLSSSASSNQTTTIPASSYQPFDYRRAPFHLQALHKELCCLQQVHVTTGKPIIESSSLSLSSSSSCTPETITMARGSTSTSLSPTQGRASVRKGKRSVRSPQRRKETTLPPKLPLPPPTPLDKRVAVVDCTLYNGEPILPFRIAMLYHVVDWFYITEGAQTYQKTRKTQFYKDLNAHLFEPFRDKIRWLVFDASQHSSLGQDATTWDVEIAQRQSPVDHMIRHVAEGKLSHPFVVINADADEIPNPDVVANFQPGGKLHKLVTGKGALLGMLTFMYNLHWAGDNYWDRAHTIPGTWIVNKTIHLDKYRFSRGGARGVKKDIPVIRSAGYHVTYGLDVAGIRRKLESFAHAEFNLEALKRTENIQNAISTGGDVLRRSGNSYQPSDVKQTVRIHMHALHEELCRLQQVNATTGAALSPIVGHNSTNMTSSGIVAPTMVDAILATRTINPHTGALDEVPVFVEPLPMRSNPSLQVQQ